MPYNAKVLKKIQQNNLTKKRNDNKFCHLRRSSLMDVGIFKWVARFLCLNCRGCGCSCLRCSCSCHSCSCIKLYTTAAWQAVRVCVRATWNAMQELKASKRETKSGHCSCPAHSTSAYLYLTLSPSPSRPLSHSISLSLQLTLPSLSQRSCRRDRQKARFDAFEATATVATMALTFPNAVRVAARSSSSNNSNIELRVPNGKQRSSNQRV